MCDDASVDDFSVSNVEILFDEPIKKQDTIYLLSEFILEFLEYIDDEHLKTFLSFFSSKKEMKKNKITSHYKYKAQLLYILMQRKNIKLVLCHLQGIFECYNSYKSKIFTDKKFLNEINDLIKKHYNISLNKIDILTDKDLTKLFGMIIDCYKDNKYYYSFSDDLLIKMEIREEHTNKKREYKLFSTLYDLEEKYGQTLIIQREKYINDKLDIILPKNFNYNKDESYKDDSKFIHNLIKTFDCIGFQKIKRTHDKFMRVINNSIENYCLWCSPNPTKLGSRKLCNNCKNLDEEINYFKNEILNCNNYNRINQYLLKVAEEIDFNELVLKTKINKPIMLKNMREKRKKSLEKIFNKADEEVKQEIENLSNKQMPTNQLRYYCNLANIIQNIKLYINKSFSN